MSKKDGRQIRWERKERKRLRETEMQIQRNSQMFGFMHSVRIDMARLFGRY